MRNIQHGHILPSRADTLCYAAGIPFLWITCNAVIYPVYRKLHNRDRNTSYYYVYVQAREVY